MPTYDYECNSCKHKFEKFHSITAEPVKDCPECGKPEARRLIGGGMGIIFKGKGFYTTDYKKSPASTGTAPSTTTKSENTPKNDTQKDSSSKSESKKESSSKAAS